MNCRQIAQPDGFYFIIGLRAAMWNHVYSLVPWFRIKTLQLSLTLTNIPHHTHTLIQSQTQTSPKNNAFSNV